MCGMQRKEFLKLVRQALKELPGEFKNRLENVDVVVEDHPPLYLRDLIKKDEDKFLLGLYHGVPLNRRGRQYYGVLPDKIIIFKQNIERIYSSKEDIKEAIKRTVQHEIAHHFGISDARLRKLGLY